VRRVRIRVERQRADRGGRDEHACPTLSRRALEPEALDGGEALVVARRLELAERAHLLRRREQPRLGACDHLQLRGRRELAEPPEQAFDEVHLRLGERRVRPEAPHGEAVASSRLDDVVAGRAREICVVEDELA